jgi:hypothetical protein
LPPEKEKWLSRRPFTRIDGVIFWDNRGFLQIKKPGMHGNLSVFQDYYTDSLEQSK